MLYDDNIEFNGGKYKNIFRLLDSLINDGVLKPITTCEKSTLLNILDKKISIKNV